MKMIFGLGNPEPKYSWTRHNAGKELVNMYAEHIREKLNLGDWSFNKKLKAFEIRSKDFVLVKPDCFMNEVGGTVKKSCMYYETALEDLIVCYDELDLEVGEFKLNFRKGSPIHNGVLSINSVLGGNLYWNLRVGVRDPKLGFSVQKSGVDPSQYVLKHFPISHKKKISQLYEQGVFEELDRRLSIKM